MHHGFNCEGMELETVQRKIEEALLGKRVPSRRRNMLLLDAGRQVKPGKTKSMHKTRPSKNIWVTIVAVGKVLPRFKAKGQERDWRIPVGFSDGSFGVLNNFTTGRNARFEEWVWTKPEANDPEISYNLFIRNSSRMPEICGGPRGYCIKVWDKTGRQGTIYYGSDEKESYITWWKTPEEMGHVA
jgi:hypothetical protein